MADQDGASAANPVPLDDSESSDSPYMLMPDSESSEMRLVIEGSECTQQVSPATANRVIDLNLTGSGSQCCLLM